MGSARGRRAARDAQQHPVREHVWTLNGFDYLVTYHLLEWLNLGYLRRYEDRMRREQGIEYMLRPSAVA